MALEIRETTIGGKLTEFLDVVDYIYRDDRSYVRPLDIELKHRLSPKNPYFDHADGVALTAHRNGWCLGRITAQLDRAHWQRHGQEPAAGFFGFFDTIDDAEVASELLNAAGRWLRDRGAQTMFGPVSLSLNEELGCLIDGFETRPAMTSQHHRPYQAELLESAGFVKRMDVYAMRCPVGAATPGAQSAHQQLQARPELVTRHIDMKNLDAELRVISEVLSDAFAKEWSFAPRSERELSKLAADLKLFAVPELSFIAEVDGEPAAAALALPNLNELIADLGGKLVPLGWPKLLWRLKVVGAKTSRLSMLGVKRQFAEDPAYASLPTHLLLELDAVSKRLGLEWTELSCLESDTALRATLEAVGGRAARTYRLFDKPL